MVGALEPTGTVQLEVTSRCNLACRACPRSVPDFGMLERDMPREIFDRVVDESIRAGRHYHLQGWGEPMLRPDLPDLAAAITARGGMASTTTNGTIMSHDLARRLVEAGLSFVTFSVSGGTTEAQGTARPGAGLQLVLENIALLKKTRRRKREKQPVLAASFEMTRSRIGTLRDAVRKLKKAGIERMIAIHPILALTPAQRRELLVEVDDTAEWEEPLRGFRRGVASSMFRSLPLENEPLRARRGAGCREEPSLNLFVGATGDLSPCAFLGIPGGGEHEGPHRLIFGNILRSTLREIWNSAEYVAFRQAWSTGTAPEACRHCLRSLGY